MVELESSSHFLLGGLTTAWGLSLLILGGLMLVGAVLAARFARKDPSYAKSKEALPPFVHSEDEDDDEDLIRNYRATLPYLEAYSKQSRLESFVRYFAFAAVGFVAVGFVGGGVVASDALETRNVENIQAAYGLQFEPSISSQKVIIPEADHLRIFDGVFSTQSGEVLDRVLMQRDGDMITLLVPVESGSTEFVELPLVG